MNKGNFSSHSRTADRNNTKIYQSNAKELRPKIGRPFLHKSILSNETHSWDYFNSAGSLEI